MSAGALPSTAPGMLARLLERAPRSRAVDVGGERLTYADLDRRARALGSALLESGLRPGDRVAIWMPNCAAWVVAFVAGLLSGIVVVPVNARQRETDVDYTLRHSGARVLITRGTFFGQFAAVESLVAWAGGPPGSSAWRRRWPDLDRVAVVDEGAAPRGFVGLAELESSGSGRIEASPGPESRAVIQYTSGTTGAPKGAVLPQRSIIGVAGRVAARLGLEPEDRLVCPLPFFHIGGLVLGLLVPLSRGAFAISMDRFVPDAMLDLVEAHEATMVGALETMYLDLIEALGRRPRRLRLRGGFGAGSPGTMRRASEALGLEGLVNLYGMTETGPTISMADRTEAVHVRTETVGRPLPDVSLRLKDLATGETITGAWRDGEIQVQGFNLMEGYLDDPEGTRAAFDAEWFRTGDVGCFDEAGNLVFRTRLRNLIRVGGESFGPQEVEDLIETMPGVRRVGVVGVPDERLGEVPWALVELQDDVRLTAGTVAGWCKGRIADFKIPRRVLFVEEVPLGPSGKLERKSLLPMARALVARGAP